MRKNNSKKIPGFAGDFLRAERKCSAENLIWYTANVSGHLMSLLLDLMLSFFWDNRLSVALPLGLIFILFPANYLFSQVPNGSLTPEERSTLTQQLEALEAEAAKLDREIANTQTEARTLSNEVKIIDKEIKKKEVEIRRLSLVIRQTQADIRQKTANIGEAKVKIGGAQKSLSASVKQLSQEDADNLLILMLKNDSLSDFFLILNNNEQLQEKLQSTLGSLREYKTVLEEEKDELEEYQKGQEDTKSIQEINRRSLADKRKERDQLLKLTQGKETLFQQLLKQKKTDIATIKNKLFYLQQAGITAEQALSAAKSAAGRTGIRTAFLLALLEVETGKQFENGQITVGHNLGTGNWKRDMYDCYVNLGKPKTAESQKTAFFQITSELGINPDTAPVSRMPNYGCGGAMGPAQFIPTTWVLFKDRVANLTGRGMASPWNVEDAFTAAALYLADAGATSQQKAGEIAAARTYISGRPNCPPVGAARTACLSYANRVYELSREIERAL